MIESGTLGQKLYRGMILAVCGVFFCSGAWAQSNDAPVPLGDVARSMRKKKEQPQQPQPEAPLPGRTVIDNDNFSQVLDQAEALHITHGNFLYTFDQAGRTFQVFSPDVPSSLSFTSRAASLLSRPFVQMDLPEEELRKLDGPAAISDQGLQVSVFNGTQWQVGEIKGGLTIFARPEPESYGRLLRNGKTSARGRGNPSGFGKASGHHHALPPEGKRASVRNHDI